MTEKEKLRKLWKSITVTFPHYKNAAKELKTVFKFVADESNRKQRELIGLDKEK